MQRISHYYYLVQNFCMRTHFQMKSFLALLFTIQFCIFCCTVFSQSARVAVAREPEWITKNAIDYYRTSLDKHATDGYIDIDFELQVSLTEQCEYVRRSKRIISQAGVQNASQVEVSFNPSYQQLLSSLS